MSCPYCGAERRPWPVYKKVWWCCTRCGVARAVPRARFPLDGLPWLPAPLRHDPTAFTDPGGTWHRSSIQPGDTHYDGEPERLRALAQREGVDLSGAILDISGGPGFVARDLARTARRVVMTDYTRQVLPFARSLGVEAVYYDYQADAPPVEGPFDLVMVRFSLNFCLDLDRFLGHLAPLGASTVFVAGFFPPSRGACLTSALEDFGPQVLWPPEVVEAAFQRGGWRMDRRFDASPSMPYWGPRSWRYRAFSLPWELGPGPLPRDPLQHHAGFVFRR